MSELVKLEKRLDKRFDDMIAAMSQFADEVKTRFDQQDARFDRIEQEIRLINNKYDHLIQTIDGFLARIDRYETEQTARDSQFEKLLVWARKVSEKTGIPLENL